MNKINQNSKNKIGNLIFYLFQNIAQQIGPKNGKNGDGSL